MILINFLCVYIAKYDNKTFLKSIFILAIGAGFIINEYEDILRNRCMDDP